jgi:uncharacterized RDD family membrane protein YckC
MRCPKCRYISFERVERCRNCGYDFSLASEPQEPELPLRDGAREPIGPFTDLTLDDRVSPAAADSIPHDADDVDLRRLSGRLTDLPLFGGPAPAPRAPLAVRRSAAPEPVAHGTRLERVVRRPEVEQPSPRSSELREVRRPARIEAPRFPLEPAATASSRAVKTERDETPDGAPASAPRRLAAAIIDSAIVLATDVGVLYFTLRLCGLSFAEALAIPPVPFVGFLLMLNGGYLAAFTAASGQTIGKMAAGIKVVGEPGSEAETPSGVSFASAALRTAAYLASALPAGLGFVPGFIGRDRRALHDRLAETRVVRASLAR